MNRGEMMALARHVRECARQEMCSDCPMVEECAVWYKLEYAVSAANKHGQLIAALADYIDELEAMLDGKCGKP